MCSHTEGLDIKSPIYDQAYVGQCSREKKVADVSHATYESRNILKI